MGETDEATVGNHQLMIYARFPAARQAMVVANQVIGEPPIPPADRR